MSKLTRALAELAKRADAGDTVARQVIDVEAARLTSQGFPEDTAMRIATGELPMDTASRNARAVEQGYDPFETWYHGTADDITAFDPAKSQSRDFGHAGKGTYVASHPGIARAYANTAAGSADANIMPLRTSANNPLRISLEEKQALGQAGPSATARLQQQAISEGFDSIEVIMPNGEILEKVIFDPANIRSTNAAFDPANKGKSALLGGLGGAAVIGGTMTPEEAQAGPLSAGARRIIDPRFSQPVAGGSERKAVRGALETMQTDIDPRLMDVGSPVTLQDYEGYPYMLTQSDRSAAGGMLTGIHGQSIDPVNLQGGRDFMFDPQSGNLVWASDPNVVKTMYKRAMELREKFGKDPILLPYTMAPTGIDFARMPLDTMINYARQGMSKANIKKLDSQIKKVIPGWTSVMDPEVNAMFRNVGGNQRKIIANIIDKNFRDVPGGLSMGEARAATSDIAQYTSPDGSLLNVGRIDTSQAPIADSGHSTYKGGLVGEGIGRLTEDLDVRPFMAARGRELTGGPEDIRSLSMNPAFSQGVVDEKLLRNIYDTQSGRLQEIATKYGVSIPVAAMALMGDAEEAQAGPLSAAGRAAQMGLPVRPAREDLNTVLQANMIGGRVVGDETVPIDSLMGGAASSKRGQDAVNRITEQMSGPDGYIERLIVDQDGNVIEGAHRLDALRRLGIRDVPVTRISDPTAGIDVAAMSQAINDVGVTHPDHVNQIVASVGEMLAEVGGDPAKVLDQYVFPRGYEDKFRAALGALGVAGAAGSAQASEYPSLGGMGVRMPPTAEDEEAMLAPTGGDLMQQANRDFAGAIRTQPEPDFLTGVQQSLLSGIMKTAGVADLSADVVSAMAGPLLSAPGAIARYAADRYVPGVNYSAEEMAQGRRETEDYFNYQPRTEQGPQYGEQIMQGIGGAIAPYVPAIKKAAGDSYILGAMRQGYDYLGEREKELAKALMDLSPI
jgi:hypothetical protein